MLLKKISKAQGTRDKAQAKAQGFKAQAKTQGSRHKLRLKVQGTSQGTMYKIQERSDEERFFLDANEREYWFICKFSFAERGPKREVNVELIDLHSNDILA
jgi:hypothetical protein